MRTLIIGKGEVGEALWKILYNHCILSNCSLLKSEFTEFLKKLNNIK